MALEWFLGICALGIATSVAVFYKFYMPSEEPLPEPIIPPPMPKPEFPPMIEKWADAIAIGEGARPELCNPGNLKYASLTASWGAVKGRLASDGGYLCKFPTPEAGRRALCNFLLLGAENQLISFHHARTLEKFSQVYGGNPPQGYIDGIAKHLGVSTSVDISTFLT